MKINRKLLIAVLCVVVAFICSLTITYVSSSKGLNISNDDSSSTQNKLLYTKGDKDILSTYGTNGPVSNGDVNEIGTIVAIGSEQFYTIGSDDTSVKLLSLYNLHVGNSVNIDWTVTPLKNPTGIQASNAKGWILDDTTYIGTTVFSETGPVYSGSIVETYVNDYKTILTDYFNVDVIEARIPTQDELVNDFDCSIEKERCSRDKYLWISSTTYWVNSYASNNRILSVTSNGVFSFADYSNATGAGVRPVIVISKDYF